MQSGYPVMIDSITQYHQASLDFEGGLMRMLVCIERTLRRGNGSLPGQRCVVSSQTSPNYFLCLALRSDRFDG